MTEPSRERLLFAGLSAARVAFYGAHYLAARWLSRDTVAERARPAHPTPSLAVLAENVTALFVQDWKNVEAGLYPAPLDFRREMRGALSSLRYLADMPRVLQRQRTGVHDEARDKGEGLPAYYRRNFHFQTDGYLSERSARLYDFQVEALFAGTAEAMRRRAYVPVARYLTRCKLKGPVILDVGAGTGRFLSFVKSMQPQAKAIALDLSAPYLARAEKRAVKMGQEIEILAAPVEKMPLADASADVVTSIYLFHELPPKVRAAAAKEIARVLKPGGIFVFADSIQYGDAPGFDGLIEVFPALLHEPYYESYAKTDLKRVFADAGLMAAHVDIAYLTKVVTFEKPR